MKRNAFILLFPLRVFTVAPCLLVRSDVWACIETCPWSDPPCEACPPHTSAYSSVWALGTPPPSLGLLLLPSPFTQIQISLPSRLPLSHKLFPNRIRERQGLVGVREHLGRRPHFTKSEVFSELPQVARSLESICSASFFLLCGPAHPGSEQAGFMEILRQQPESMPTPLRLGSSSSFSMRGNLVSPLFCFCFCSFNPHLRIWLCWFGRETWVSIPGIKPTI